MAHKLEETLKTTQTGVRQQYLLAVVTRMQACDTVSEGAFAVAGTHSVLATAQSLDSHSANDSKNCLRPPSIAVPVVLVEPVCSLVLQQQAVNGVASIEDGQ